MKDTVQGFFQDVIGKIGLDVRDEGYGPIFRHDVIVGPDCPDLRHAVIDDGPHFLLERGGHFRLQVAGCGIVRAVVDRFYIIDCHSADGAPENLFRPGRGGFRGTVQPEFQVIEQGCHSDLIQCRFHPDQGFGQRYMHGGIIIITVGFTQLFNHGLRPHP